jgi:YbgC/YbaW family acyl-CoA thioester hydrolase
MPYEFKLKRRVQFADTDMAGIMHFTNFFRYMEETEHAFYRSLGFSVDMDKAHKSLGFGWPRVQASCDYLHPLRFEDEVEVHLIVAEIKSKTVRFVFIFRKTDGGKQLEVARGGMTVICVTRDRETNRMKAANIPSVIRSKLEVAPHAS